MGNWLISGAGLVGFAVLCLSTIPRHAREIELDVLKRTTEALQAGQVAMPSGGVQVSGRDVTLTAARGEALVSDEIRDLVATIWGVRSVRVKIVGTPTARWEK
jgi:hypothetical protein